MSPAWPLVPKEADGREVGGSPGWVRSKGGEGGPPTASRNATWEGLREAGRLVAAAGQEGVVPPAKEGPRSTPLAAFAQGLRWDMPGAQRQPAHPQGDLGGKRNQGLVSDATRVQGTSGRATGDHRPAREAGTQARMLLPSQEAEGWLQVALAGDKEEAG